jgi:hypothetical protein
MPVQLLPMLECNRQPVFQINGVTLARSNGRIEVQVDAVAPTPLWTEPKLVAKERSAGRTLELDFTACRPRGYVVQVLVPITVRQVVDFEPRSLDQVIVHGQTNSMSARVAEFFRQ